MPIDDLTDDDLHDLLVRSAPAVEPPTSGVVRRDRAALLLAIEDEGGDTSPAPLGSERRGHRPHRRTPLLLAAAAVAAVFALALANLVDLTSPGGGRAEATPLGRSAAIAAAPPVQAAATDARPVLHLTYAVVTDDPGREGISETWEAWRDRDGSGREVRSGQVRDIAPSDGVIEPGEAWVTTTQADGSIRSAARDDGTAGTFGRTIGGYPVTAHLLAGLPADVDGLRASLTGMVGWLAVDGPNAGPVTTAAGLAGQAPGPEIDREPAGSVDPELLEQHLFDAASQLLDAWIAGPQLRSAALDLVASLDRVTVVDGVDPEGRAALVVSRSTGGPDTGQVMRFTVDAVTSQVTSIEVVDAGGAALSRQVLLASEWVAAVP